MREARTRARSSQISRLVAKGNASFERSARVSRARRSRARGPITPSTAYVPVTSVRVARAPSGMCRRIQSASRVVWGAPVAKALVQGREAKSAAGLELAVRKRDEVVHAHAFAGALSQELRAPVEGREPADVGLPQVHR